MCEVPFLLVFIVFAGAIVAVHLATVVGAFVSFARERTTAQKRNVTRAEAGGRLRVSVLVPARDEETNLPRLLESLEAQETTDFEIVIVNDRSTDATPRIIENFATRHPGRVRTVTLTDDPQEGNPKQRALAAGVKEATGGVILMTDADCSVSPGWVRTMSTPFADSAVGLVFGAVIPGTTGLGRRTRALDRFQSFDQVFRFQYTAGAAGLGAPSGGFGNNIAVRRAALDDAGGFEGLEYSTTEDAQLICQVRDTGKWKIRAIRSAGSHVAPAPEPDLPSLVRQSIRWNTGGLFAPDRTARVSYGVVMLYLFASVLVLPAALLFPPLALPALGSFTSMLLLGTVAGLLSRRRADYWLRLLPHVLFAMVFYTYVTILTLAHVPQSWKGRALKS